MCEVNKGNCDKEPNDYSGNGCETNLTADPNCGACGIDCSKTNKTCQLNVDTYTCQN